MMSIARPYLLFLGDARDQLAAKTAEGVFQWRPEWCVGKVRLDGCNADLDLPEMTLEAAIAAGAKTLLVGVANAGGTISERWTGTLVRAVELGMDVASGLHHRLTDVAPLAEAASRNGRRLIDVRHPTQAFDVGQGEPRPGRRLLTVGTDCSVGKMYATLALEAELKRRNRSVAFRATGQTGIFIAGDGVCVDAVVADFISGAVEWLCPPAHADHWDLIEGQGSLFHPSFAGVSLGLLHGARPDVLVMCHEPTRPHMRGLPDRPVPDVAACIEVNLQAAELIQPRPVCVGVAVNTRHMDRDAAARYLATLEDSLGLPCVDPVATGVGPIVDRLA